MEVSYGDESRQQASKGDQEPLQAHSQRQTPGTRAHSALQQEPTSLILSRQSDCRQVRAKIRPGFGAALPACTQQRWLAGRV